VFTAASVLCGIATSQGLLVAARALQGVGGAMTSAVVLGMPRRALPRAARTGPRHRGVQRGRRRGRSARHLLGGALTQALNWHWIFLINLPIGVVAWVAALRILAPTGESASARAPTTPARRSYGCADADRVRDRGAGDRGLGGTLALAAVSLALFAAFTVRQARAARPLLRLRLFRSRLLTGANSVQILMIAGMFGFQYVGALYLQRVLGYSELLTGTAFLPAPVAIGVLMLGLSARTIARFRPVPRAARRARPHHGGHGPAEPGPVDGAYVTDVLPPLLLLAAGFAAAMPAVTGLAMSGARGEDGGARLRAVQHHAGGGRFTGPRGC